MWQLLRMHLCMLLTLVNLSTKTPSVQATQAPLSDHVALDVCCYLVGRHTELIECVNKSLLETAELSAQQLLLQEQHQQPQQGRPRGRSKLVLYVSNSIHDYAANVLLANSVFFESLIFRRTSELFGSSSFSSSSSSSLTPPFSSVSLISEDTGANVYPQDVRWNKIKAVSAALIQDPLLEYVVSIDADLLFLSPPGTRITGGTAGRAASSKAHDHDSRSNDRYDFTTSTSMLSFESLLKEHSEADLIISEDVIDMANSGLFIVRNTKWALSFLDAWWAERGAANTFCDQHAFNSVYKRLLLAGEAATTKTESVKRSTSTATGSGGTSSGRSTAETVSESSCNNNTTILDNNNESNAASNNDKNNNQFSDNGFDNDNDNDITAWVFDSAHKSKIALLPHKAINSMWPVVENYDESSDRVLHLMGETHHTRSTIAAYVANDMCSRRTRSRQRQHQEHHHHRVSKETASITTSTAASAVDEEKDAGALSIELEKKTLISLLADSLYNRYYESMRDVRHILQEQQHQQQQQQKQETEAVSTSMMGLAAEGDLTGGNSFSPQEILMEKEKEKEKIPLTEAFSSSSSSSSSSSFTSSSTSSSTTTTTTTNISSHLSALHESIVHICDRSKRLSLERTKEPKQYSNNNTNGNSDSSDSSKSSYEENGTNCSALIETMIDLCEELISFEQQKPLEHEQQKGNKEKKKTEHEQEDGLQDEYRYSSSSSRVLVYLDLIAMLQFDLMTYSSSLRETQHHARSVLRTLRDIAAMSKNGVAQNELYVHHKRAIVFGKLSERIQLQHQHQHQLLQSQSSSSSSSASAGALPSPPPDWQLSLEYERIAVSELSEALQYCPQDSPHFAGYVIDYIRSALRLATAKYCCCPQQPGGNADTDDNDSDNDSAFEWASVASQNAQLLMRSYNGEKRLMAQLEQDIASLIVRITAGAAAAAEEEKEEEEEEERKKVPLPQHEHHQVWMTCRSDFEL